MANLDLSKYGIQDVKEILHNPSYEVLSIPDVLLKINSLLRTKPAKTLYGGLLMLTRTTTSLALKKHGPT